ncbi:MAG: DUF4402 domain-containing protein [Longimicrobiales bacterium]
MTRIMTVVLAGLVMAVVLPVGAVAQSSASANASVTATIIKGLTLTKNNDLSFGTVAANTGANSVNAQSSANAAKFTADGEADTGITVSWTAPATLTDGTNTIAVTSIEVYGQDADTQGASASLTSGGTVTLNGSGGYYFWVGGAINVGAVPAGTYSGTFSMTVAY